MNTFWTEGERTDPSLDDPRSYYEAAAETIDSMHRGESAFSEPRWRYIVEDLIKVRQHLSTIQVGSIIDLGCGAGQWADFYIRNATDITLVDLSPLLLERASQRITQLNPNISFSVVPTDIFSNVDKLPLRGRSTALCAFLLSHYEPSQIVTLLTLIRESIGPNAQVVVIDSWYSQARRLKRERVTTRSINIHGKIVKIQKRYFTPEEWDEITREAGFSIRSQWWGSAFFISQCVV